MTSAPGQPSTSIVIANATSCVITQTISASTKTNGVYHVANLSINFSASDFESCASSTSSMILPNVVSSPTFCATICIVPLSKIVPANTLESTTF